MKVLVADDNPAFRTLMGEMLRSWGYEVISVPDGRAAWNRLQAEHGPRLALVDWMMPGLDGPELCRLLRRQTDRPYVYVLLLTGRANTGDLVKGLDAGADDYLIKPIEADELRARLHAGRRVLELQERLLAAQEVIRHQATHDPLTSLCNRGVVLDALQRELDRGWREARPVGVLLTDIDHFKHINDTHGHLAGDAVLREVSRVMSHALRSYDTLGRYGGEEFLAILPDCDEESTFKLGERLRQAVAAEPIRVREGAIPVTLSVGVAASSVCRRADGESLLRSADAALYRAKRSGRNRVERGTLPSAVELLGVGPTEA